MTLRNEAKVLEYHLGQSVQISDLHLEVQAALRRTPYGFVVSATKRLVTYVTLVDGLKSEEVTLERLAQPDILAVARRYWRKYTYRPGDFRRLLKETGYAGNLEKNSNPYHPMLREWLEKTCGNDRPKIWRIRPACTSFLTWLSENQSPMYRPHELPVQFLLWDYLVAYRRHLLADGQRRQVTMTTLKRKMQFVVAWVRWLVDEGKISDVDTTGLALTCSKWNNIFYKRPILRRHH